MEDSIEDLKEEMKELRKEMDNLKYQVRLLRETLNVFTDVGSEGFLGILSEIRDNLRNN